MKTSMASFRRFLQIFGVAGLIGCGTSNQISIPEIYSIEFREEAGMLPQATTIYLSNSSPCYVHMMNDGVKTSQIIQPNIKALDDLVIYMQSLQFKKMRTYRSDVMDRGGSSVSLKLDDQEIHVSNMQDSFVKERWSSAYRNIVNRIKAIARYDQLSKVAGQAPKAMAINLPLEINPGPELLESQNLSPLAQSDLLHLDIKMDETDLTLETFQLAIHYRGVDANMEIPLLETFGSFQDTYADIHYSLYQTQNPKAPYLFYFSGQAGDEYNTDGKLILFDQNNKIAELIINGGNRINSELREIVVGKVSVKESFMCHQSVYTTIAYSENGLERLEGTFPANTIYPNNEDVPEPSHRSAYTLLSDLEVIQQEETRIYKAGQSIRMELISVDFDFEAIYLKINGEPSSMRVDKYKMNQLVQSMYGAKCEMG